MEFADLAAQFPEHDRDPRSIILVEVSRISDSCGYGVPLLEYEGERSQLSAWAHKLGPEGLNTYRQEKIAKVLTAFRASKHSGMRFGTQLPPASN